MVINTLTLISVIQADLLPDNYTATLSEIGKVFENIKHLYDENKMQVLILSTMAFTTILWVFKVIQLIIACMMYLCYLMRVMGKGTLRGYCKERVDKRMGSIVTENHKVGVKREHRQPTLPLELVTKASQSTSGATIPKPPDKAVIADRLTESPVSYVGPRSRERDNFPPSFGRNPSQASSRASSARERAIHPLHRTSPPPMPRQNNGRQMSVATTVTSDASSFSRFGSTASTLVQTPSEASYRGDVASQPAGRGRFPIKIGSGNNSDYRRLDSQQPVMNPPLVPVQGSVYSGQTTSSAGMSFDRTQNTPSPPQYGQRGVGDVSGYAANQGAPTGPSPLSVQTSFQQRVSGYGYGYADGGDPGQAFSHGNDDNWNGYDDGYSPSWPLQPEEPRHSFSLPPHPLTHTNPDGYDDQRLPPLPPPPPRSPAQQQTYSHHLQQLRSPASSSVYSSAYPSPTSYTNQRPQQWQVGAAVTPAEPILRSETAPPSTTAATTQDRGRYGYGGGDVGRSRTVGGGYGGREQGGRV